MSAVKAIIHLDNFSRNIMAVRGRIGPKRHICVPVKADAYGHGAAAIAEASLAAGVFCLGVANVHEGVALREAGIRAPVLLFSQPVPSDILEIIERRFIPFVSDGEFAAKLDRAAAEVGTVRFPVHLKIDTGMGRMGCAPEDAPGLARQISSCAALEYAGTATHFAVADSAAPDDYAYTKRQIACFNTALDSIRAAGLNPGIVHAANSGAVMLHPGAWFDMVRPGILLYGYNTVGSGGNPNLPPLRVEPVMELRTSVVFVKQVKKGETVSYGRTWTAPHDTVIAALAVGYADGLPRLASNKWQAVIGGKAYPLAGRICMDQCMVDLGPAPEVRRWDEAVIFGGTAPDAAVLAGQTGTIPYEITCNINKRVPRIYVGR
jgi:alanine racemase